MYIAKNDMWYMERIIWMIAGVVVLLSTTLAAFVSPWWHVLTVMVGVNLLIFASTGFCIMANILYKLGVKPLERIYAVNEKKPEVR